MARNSASPKARRPRYHFTRPGRYWLLAAGILWVAGVSKGMNVIILMSYLMALVWFLNLFLAGRRLGYLRIETTCPPPRAVPAGTPFKLEVELVNQSRHVIEAVEVEMHGSGHEAACFVDLEPGAAQFRARVTPIQRGWYYFTPVRVSSSFPFGLVERRVVAPEIDGILVYPLLGELDSEHLLRLLSGRIGRDGVRQRRAPGREEFHGLREYRDGDSLRAVHWRTSARRGELMVKEFDDRAARDLVVVLDPYLPAGELPRREQRAAELALEQAVSLAATLCDSWCQEAGSQLCLAVAGKSAPVVVTGNTGELEASLFHECLALVPGSAELDLEALAARVTEQLPRAPVVLVSPRPGQFPIDLALRLGREVLPMSVGHDVARECYRPPLQQEGQA